MEGNHAESRSKELEFEYRDYLENGEGMPAGTEVGNYKIEREIGKGAFGKIYLARDRCGGSFAVKLMDLEKIRREANPKIQEIRWRLVRNEPALMQQCNSPNVLRCWEIFENESLKVLVLEYCNGHTLQEFLDRKIRINEEEAVRILRQVINGIAELHKHSIIHRDLKADNIMEHEGQYKIIDLGFSKKLDIANEQAEVKGTILGTVTTMAPEVLSKLSYGLKADIWSIGVIFFQMVFGVLLYDSVSARQRLKEIEDKRYFSPDKELTFNGITISAYANNFLFRALEVNTEKRMGWRELLQHPLIRQKDEEPIGERFLVQNDLHLPEVNLDLTVEPTIRISPSVGPTNFEDLELINNFKPNLEDSQQAEPSREREEPQEVGERREEVREQREEQKKGEEVKKNGFKINMQKDRFPVREENQRWKIQDKKNEEEHPLLPFEPIKDPINSKPAARPVEEVRRWQEDSADYRWVKLAHHECLKTELIYHQIMVPIERGKLLDLGEREVVQFMFLMAARCFQNVSPISVRVEEEKARVNPIVKNLHVQVRDLYQKVLEKFEGYSQLLTQLENNFFQMFLDFFRKRFLKKDYDERSSFTSGIEVPEDEEEQGRAGKGARYGDYSKVEQVNYTYNNYVSGMLRRLRDNKKLPALTVEKVAGYLRYYDRICLVTLEELDGETFAEYVRRIIL